MQAVLQRTDRSSLVHTTLPPQVLIVPAAGLFLHCIGGFGKAEPGVGKHALLCFFAVVHGSLLCAVRVEQHIESPSCQAAVPVRQTIL